MNSASANLRTGFQSFFTGFRLLFQHPQLMRLAIIPAILSVFVFIACIVGGVILLTSFGFAITLDNFKFEDARTLVITLLLIVFLPFTAGVLTLLLMKIFAGPFFGILAERTLVITGVLDRESLSIARWIASTIRLLIIGFLNAMLLSIVSAMLFAASVVLPPSSLIVALLFGMMTSFEAADYSFEALRFGFRERFRYFYGNFAYFFGFSVAVALVFWIPVLNVILFPAVVAGAAELVTQIERKQA
jgi:uncharacterized protein involved in cysteine biosynthesis